MPPENSVPPMPVNSDSLPTLDQNPQQPSQPATAPLPLSPTPTPQIPGKNSKFKIILIIIFIIVTISAIGVGSYLLIKSNAKYKSQAASDQQAATRSSALEEVKSQSEFEKIGKVTPGPSPAPDTTNFISDYYAFNLPNGWLVSKNGTDFEAYDPNHLPYKIMIKNYVRVDSGVPLADEQIKAAGTIEQKNIFRVKGHYGTNGITCPAKEEKCTKQYIVISKDKRYSAAIYADWDKITIQDLVNQKRSADEINKILNEQTLINPNISSFEDDFFGSFRFIAKP